MQLFFQAYKQSNRSLDLDQQFERANMSFKRA